MKQKDAILCKTKRFCSLKNRFHTSNAANHNVLLALFVCYDLILTGNSKFILQRGESLSLYHEALEFILIPRFDNVKL